MKPMSDDFIDFVNYLGTIATQCFSHTTIDVNDMPSIDIIHQHQTKKWYYINNQGSNEGICFKDILIGLKYFDFAAHGGGSVFLPYDSGDIIITSNHMTDDVWNTIIEKTDDFQESDIYIFLEKSGYTAQRKRKYDMAMLDNQESQSSLANI